MTALSQSCSHVNFYNIDQLRRVNAAVINTIRSHHFSTDPTSQAQLLQTADAGDFNAFSRC